MPKAFSVKYFAFTLFMGVMVLLSLWWLQPGAKESLRKAQFVIFGTQVDVLIYGVEDTRATAVIAQIQQRFTQLHQAWHAWEGEGLLQQMNQAFSQGKGVAINPEVEAFLRKTQILAAKTQYHFEPALGALFDLWGFHAKSRQAPPSEAAIAAILAAKPSIADLYFAQGQVFSRNPAVKLDLGGNAKGYFLDIAIAQLEQAGVENALVSIGGDMRILGAKGDKLWKVAINHPFQRGQAIASINARSGESIFTSGTYERYFDYQGRRYAHIIHPQTGQSAAGLVSATVITHDAMTADIAATALIVAGEQGWENIAQSLGVTEVLLVKDNGNLIMTPAMAQRLVWPSQP